MAVVIKASVTLAMILYFFSGINYAAGLKTGSSRVVTAGKISAIAGAVANLVALVTRTVISGRLPLANGYEFLLSFVFVSVLLYLLYEKMNKTSSGGTVLMFLAALLLLTVFLLMPNQHGMVAPLMPALKSPWLTSHVITAVIAYSAFLLGAALAIVKICKRDISDDLMVYQIVAGGFVMLSISIVLGGVWAEQAWGTYWGWDPKETWALITWIIYAIYLHIYRKKGWKENNANVMVVAGLVLVLFTFFGVNYLLSGLHSYASVSLISCINSMG